MVSLLSRHLIVIGRGYIRIEELIQNFAGSLVRFSLDMFQTFGGDRYLCYNGHRLVSLCYNLSKLQSLDFSINVKLIEEPSKKMMLEFVRSFQTPFWTNGPLGYVRVGVDFNRIYTVLQMITLPYVFPESKLVRSVDLIDIKFNTCQGEQLSVDFDATLQLLWSNMQRLVIEFTPQQSVPLSFLHALQCPTRLGQSQLFLITTLHHSMYSNIFI